MILDYSDAICGAIDDNFSLFGDAVLNGKVLCLPRLIFSDRRFDQKVMSKN